MQKMMPLLLAIMILSGCAANKTVSTSVATEDAMLPEMVLNSSSKTRSAYRYAIENPDIVKKYPCYCGCVRMGHESNLDCYIKDIDADGNIIFDNHAVGCDVCVDITMDVARLTNAGKTHEEISAFIDTIYGSMGPGTGSEHEEMN